MKNKKQPEMNGFEKKIYAITKWDRYQDDSIPYTYNYVPDFKTDSYIVEAKGGFYKPEVDKMIAVLKQHPELDIRFIFQYPNRKCGGRKRITCSQFAEKYGALWSTLEDIKKGLWHGKTK